MSKIYIQNMEPAWSSTASMVKTASVLSASFPTRGYARLVGGLYSSASLTSLRIYQSFDSGSNWDYYSNYAPGECTASGSAYSIEIIGDAARISACIGATTDASAFRTSWWLRPI